jgi:outer membrane protein TolC
MTSLLRKAPAVLALAACISAAAESGPSTIDLPTALRLAGTQALDVRLAAERAGEARANASAAREQFFPFLTLGAAYDHHEGRAQAVDGTLIDASKQAYLLDGVAAAQLNPGDAWYRNLAARQDREAARHAYEARRLQTTLSAAIGYLELVHAAARIGVARESLRIQSDYHAELETAVSAGLSLPIELRRIETELARRSADVSRREETRRLAAARLATLLHLDATIDLAPADATPPVITLVATNRALDALVAEALATRPELKVGAAASASAKALRNQTLYGPLVPSVGAQVLAGGLGGGTGGAWNNLGVTQDYMAGLGWRIGPGGLFDRPRQEAATSRFEASRLQEEQIHDAVIAEVVTARVQADARRDQAALAEAAVRSADAALTLSRQRRDFGVSGVLEFLQAEQALASSRDELATAWVQRAEAEYALAAAVGRLDNPSADPSSLKKSGKER